MSYTVSIVTEKVTVDRVGPHKVLAGETVSITVMDVEEGYELIDPTVECGVEGVEFETHDDTNTLTFIMPEGDVTVTIAAEEVSSGTVPIIPGGSNNETYETGEKAADVAKNVEVIVPDDVAAALTEDQETAYTEMFEAKVVPVTVGETTKYAVEVVMKAGVAEAIQAEVDAEAGDFAEAAVEAAADAVNGGKATVSTVAGLYYVVEAGSDVEGIATASCTLATGSTLDLTLPNKGTKGFYKLRVSVNPVAVPSND